MKSFLDPFEYGHGTHMGLVRLHYPSKLDHRTYTHMDQQSHFRHDFGVTGFDHWGHWLLSVALIKCTLFIMLIIC